MLKVYVCGPTVYNDVHIGNLRPIVTMDLMLKSARAIGLKFNFIHNITDIDDKIINRAIQEKKTEKEISEYYANQYLELLEKFNVDTITKIEYVTENMQEIEKTISRIVRFGYAYPDDKGNVWYNVFKSKRVYGKVSNQNIENMVYEDQNYDKHHPADFAIWKATNMGVKYQTQFGEGRPGWHTECAAIIDKHFRGRGVDIHGGGMDLTFPHHENENIQFWAANERMMISKKWIRTGQINLQGEKMSKSLQNVILAKDFIKEHHPDVLKMIFLLSSLTGTINIDEAIFENVKAIFRKIKKIYFTNHILNLKTIPNLKHDEQIFDRMLYSVFNTHFAEFNKDLNEMIKKINLNQDPVLITTLVEVIDILGFSFKDFDYEAYRPIYNEWKHLMNIKDYENADRKRAILMDKGLI
ncbi:class I tRNA ligase family protein [Mycoplasma nasistruthionis]|uniref:Class I tRNA ligase family protein n=1 Tax=Mycoplasma nasistruthionis TaxID=353852 RepID=A0A5B7XUG5_9MOLU|nr:class I tRNA ligase family protein [Mycoplasma nasistruthionis]QCZ36496.1 class I tRNA ligase family protein [Mycoplasma nasistruthionis]